MAETTPTEGTTTHRAGLFDIRFIIAALIGLYGVILVITVVLHQRRAARQGRRPEHQPVGRARHGRRRGGFVAWARLRPIVVPDDADDDDDRPGQH